MASNKKGTCQIRRYIYFRKFAYIKNFYYLCELNKIYA